MVAASDECDDGGLLSGNCAHDERAGRPSSDVHSEHDESLCDHDDDAPKSRAKAF